MAGKLFKLNFMGDVMLGRLIDQLCTTHVDCPSEARIVQSFLGAHPELRSYSATTPWGNTLSLLRSADLRLINLETAVTTHATKWPNKVFNYRMHPKNLEILKVAGIDYVTLANNHTLDFSEQGLKDTVQAVRDVGIKFAGATDSTEAGDAGKPAVLDLQGHSIQVFAASDHPSDWKRVQQFNYIDYSASTRSRLKEQIASAGPTSLRFFSVHWGPNYSWQPAQEIRDLAHFLIDECEVDIIHGHSSHHIQGVEIYKGKPIIYGCGDFVDDYALTPEYRNDISAVWQIIVIEESGNSRLRPVRLEIFPSRIKYFQAFLLDSRDTDHDWAREKLTALSREFGTRMRKELGDEGQIVIDLAQNQA